MPLNEARAECPSDAFVLLGGDVGSYSDDWGYVDATADPANRRSAHLQSTVP